MPRSCSSCATLRLIEDFGEAAVVNDANERGNAVEIHGSSLASYSELYGVRPQLWLSTVIVTTPMMIISMMTTTA
jgi:hypothetical protein